MAELQATIQGLLDEIVATGQEHGLQVAAYLHGELILDAWSGLADPASGTAVTGDTLFTVYSVSKGITATVIHILAEQGKLAYDDPIARYWPEFAANGKGDVRIRHALTHTAGLPQLPPGYGSYDLTDWPGMCARVAAQAPLFPAGEVLCYHALTSGWILGGVAERIDGRPFPRIVAEEIASPLGLSDLYFGVPAAALARVATLSESPDLLALPPAPTVIADIAPPGSLADATMNRPEMRQACLPAYGLCTNARALARVYASLSGDGVDGVRLLPPERVRAATAVAAEGLDASSGMPLCFGLGYGLGGPESAAGPRRSAFGHGGYGGAHSFADPEYGLAVGFTKNRLTVNLPYENTTWRVTHAIRAHLGIPDS